MAEFNRIQEEIRREEQLEGARASVAASAEPQPVAIPRPTGETRQPAQVHNNHEDQPFRSFGEQLMAVRNAALPGSVVDPRLYGVRAASGLNETVPSDGGFLVQKDFSSELIRRMNELGQVVSRCRRIPISANSNGLKINGIDETSRASGSRWGGVVAYWINEADAKTGSKPKFRQIELTLHKLTGLCYATDELLQDAMAMESVVQQAFSEEFAFQVDDKIIEGNGAGEPLGIMNCPALITVAKEAGQPAATIVYENITKMWARMYARSRRSAAWFINQDVEPQLYTMGITIGTGGAPVYLPPGGASASPYSTLFGRPVIPIEMCSTLGTTGDIILADMSQYLFIDKGGIQAAQSIHVRFVYDESVFRFVYRCDGEPVWHSPLTPFKGTNTQSPFVVLATRA